MCVCVRKRSSGPTEYRSNVRSLLLHQSISVMRREHGEITFALYDHFTGRNSRYVLSLGMDRSKRNIVHKRNREKGANILASQRDQKRTKYISLTSLLNRLSLYLSVYLLCVRLTFYYNKLLVNYARTSHKINRYSVNRINVNT